MSIPLIFARQPEKRKVDSSILSLTTSCGLGSSALNSANACSALSCLQPPSDHDCPCVTVVGRSLSHVNRTSCHHAPGSLPLRPELAASLSVWPWSQLPMGDDDGHADAVNRRQSVCPDETGRPGHPVQSKARPRLTSHLRVLDAHGGHDRIHRPSHSSAGSRVNENIPVDCETCSGMVRDCGLVWQALGLVRLDMQG